MHLIHQPDVVQSIKLHSNEIRSYQQEGFLFLPGLLDSPTADAARRETLEVLSVGANLSADDASGRGAQTHKLIQSSQYLVGSTLDQVVNSPNLNAIAAQLMGGASSLYLPFTAVKTGGGGGRFAFHQDNQYTRFVDGMLGINIWIALVPMTPENGCLQICPRSHLRGTLDADAESDGHRKVKIEPQDFLPLRMRPGDAVAFTRLTVHGSGQNDTNHPRVGYGVQFYRDDVRAIWDNESPRLLKGSNRHPVGPVDKLTPPDPKGRDGH